jgi:hypothetical protein
MGGILSRVSSNTKTTGTATTEAKMGPIAMTYFEKAQSTFKPPLIANENAFLGDIATRYGTTLFLQEYGGISIGIQ